ncbi:LysR substrate-binding domain-containing protein [Rhizobium mayense]|uniref:LysR substrate-binding domain-containing protein n=1 Tax=Rhizobium mayense TaxID=1312184 RepID=A0ABT7JRN4_9HYPH|nr:LysR substrate-binding domain-containing protein [Rhizobium mayense]MDL2398936.1 LysR substrate-binding domain-containing protein [Rhizobium mayense]
MDTPPDLELDLLRAFIAVAEAGSFTAAAEVVGRSQSAVSQKVLRLEEVLQMRVLNRTSRSISLTRSGERLLLAGKRLLAQYEAFIDEMRSPAPVSLLRLGISENLVHTQLPAVLARFCREFPGIELELNTTTSEELFAEYDAGRLDVVIAKTREESSSHAGQVIWREPLVWIAGPDYQPDAKAPARLVMMRPPCMYRAIMTETLDAIGREWVTACTASNLIGTRAAVAGGLGVTVLGKSFVQPGVQVLRPSDQWPPLPATEVSVIGDVPELQHVIRPLVNLLSQTLMESASLTLDTPMASATIQ